MDKIDERSSRSKDAAEQVSFFKVRGNKKKLQVSASTFGTREEYKIIMLTDITQIKRHEKERQCSRFQKMYFNSMAHDVRTPLVSIVCSNENLKQLIKDPE